MVFSKIILFLLSTFASLSLVNPAEVSIASCNLWNVMFNWETRIKRIADMIREQELDIVVFQEVRLKNEGKKDETQAFSQLNEFRPYLPEYRWMLASSAGKVTKVKHSYHEEWASEGLGVLSRREVLFSNVVRLKEKSLKDLNKRIALYARIKLGPGEDDVLDIVVIHFSYDPNQQCQNAKDVIETVEGSNLKNAVILGDSNAYDAETPAVNVFLGSERLVCPHIASQIKGTFKDAWLNAHNNNHTSGLTFSNMPFPGLQSRPDRILVSEPLQVLTAGVVGDGRVYGQKYYEPVLLSRVSAVIKTSFQAFAGYHGYSCLHDCGPHGSCRCGICVAGGDQNNCHTPLCPECNSGKFVLLATFFMPASFACLIFFLAVIRLLVISARFSQKDIQEILGYRCCLFNRQLFQTKLFPRRYRISLSNFVQLYHLPPVWVILGASLFLLVLFPLFKMTFKDSIDLVYRILPEELFPSDHKIVYAKLKV